MTSEYGHGGDFPCIAGTPGGARVGECVSIDGPAFGCAVLDHDAWCLHSGVASSLAAGDVADDGAVGQEVLEDRRSNRGCLNAILVVEARESSRQFRSELYLQGRRLGLGSRLYG